MMPETSHRLKKSGKDNGYHPFAKEEKEHKSSVKPKLPRQGSGLLGLGNRRNTLYSRASERCYERTHRNSLPAEINTEITDFFSRLSNIPLHKWECLLGNELEGRNSSIVNEPKPSAKKTDSNKMKSFDNSPLPVKADKPAVVEASKSGQDYSGSYLFTKKTETSQNTQKVGTSEYTTEKDKRISPAQTDKPMLKLPHSAVRLSSKPTQPNDSRGTEVDSKTKEPMRENASIAPRHSTNNKVFVANINEKSYDAAKYKCLVSVAKLLDYIERPPRVKFPPESATRLNSMQVEFRNQLNSLKRGLDVSTRTLSSDHRLAQSLSNLAITIDSNIDALHNGIGKVPVKLMPLIEPIKNEVLQFKEALGLLVNCLPHNTKENNT